MSKILVLWIDVEIEVAMETIAGPVANIYALMVKKSIYIYIYVRIYVCIYILSNGIDLWRIASQMQCNRAMLSNTFCLFLCFSFFFALAHALEAKPLALIKFERHAHEASSAEDCELVAFVTVSARKFRGPF